MILQSTNVLIVGGIGIGPHIITSCVFIVKSFLFPINEKSEISISFKWLFAVYTIFLLYILFNGLFINHFSSWTGAIMIAIYLFSAYRLLNVGHMIDKKYIEKNIDFLVVFTLIIGAIVCLQQVGLFPNIGLLKVIFFNDEISGTVAYNTITTHRFYATFMEPSYCACFLVGCIAYYLCTGKTTTKYIALIVFLSLALVLTMSSTGYGCFALVLFLFLISRTNKKTIKIILPAGIFAVLLFLVLFPNLLNDVIFSKLTTASGQTRQNWNLFALESFYSSPVFGIGFSNQRASSLFYTLIAELGIIGVIIYFIFLAIIVATILLVNYKKQKKQFLFFVFAVIVGQIIACPDYNFCVFWLSIYLLALGENPKEVSLRRYGKTNLSPKTKRALLGGL